MRLFNGKKVAAEILKDLKQRIRKEKLKPKLAVILVGEDEASKIYIRLKKEAAERVGIEFELYKYDDGIKEKEIIAKIEELNTRNDKTGIIVQLPLPPGLNKDKIISAIDPTKDVDGFHEENRRLFGQDEPRFKPVLPSAILAAIKDAIGENVAGKKAVALVNSDIFGKTLELVLRKQRIDFKYIIRNVCSIGGAESDLKEADIVISVCGCPELITGDMIKKGAVVVDAGIFRSKDGKVVGDVDCASVENVASFLTPVPGGLGPLVIALLLENVYIASKIKK